MCLDKGAVRRRYAPDLGRDELEDGFFGCYCLGQPLQQFCVHAIRDENAKLSAFEAFGTPFNDAELYSD